MTTYTIAETNLILDAAEKQYVLRVKDLPAEEKPREKLAKFGAEFLTVNELLSIVLNVGTKKEGVMEMTNRLLKEYGARVIVDQKDPKKISETLQVPLTKACQIVACFELGRRFFDTAASPQVYVRTPKEVFEYLKDMRGLPKEHLRGLYLNSHYKIIHDEVISIGTLNASIIHPREVFKPALEHAASAVILAHNHPSGIVDASEADIEITGQLINAGKLLGITLLDHVVISKDSFASVPAQYN